MRQGAAARRAGWLWLAPPVLAAALLFGTAVGETRIPLSTVLDVLATKAGLSRPGIDPIDLSVIWNYRLSRAVVAVSCQKGRRSSRPIASAPPRLCSI